MAGCFVAQPYPLFAVTVVKADDPLRLVLSSEPVRLVLGWVQDEEGKVLPALDGAPSPQVWDGMVLYEETRERAEATARQFERAGQAAVRDARVAAFLARVEAGVDRVTSRM